MNPVWGLNDWYSHLAELLPMAVVGFVQHGGGKLREIRLYHQETDTYSKVVHAYTNIQQLAIVTSLL